MRTGLQHQFRHNREVYREFREFGLFGGDSSPQSTSKFNRLRMRFPIRPNRELAFTFQGIHRASSTRNREFSCRSARPRCWRICGQKLS
jgi:hypothetical protein